MRRAITLIAVALLATTSYGKSITVNPDAPTTLEINGPIDFQMTIPLVDNIVSQAKDGVELTLIINSPGGEVNAGMYLLNAMELAQARGATIRCVTTGLAASFAFQIFAKCDSRYSLPNSFMLYHPVRFTIGGGMFSESISVTPALAKQWSDELARMEAFLIADLRSSMKVSDEIFARNYSNETLLLAREVNKDSPNWLTLVDDIVGLKTIAFGKSNKAELKKTNGVRLIHICTVCR
jgi:ATP-dependent protease ClpP protease subunit